MTDEQGFADRMNSIPKFVASTTLGDAEWNASVIRDVATEVPTLKARHDLPSVIVRGRPGRGSSVNPSRRSSANRFRHFVTIGRWTPSSRAISTFLRPSAASSTIERCANACALDRRRAHASNRTRSSALNSVGVAMLFGITTAFPAATELMCQHTRRVCSTRVDTVQMHLPPGLMRPCRSRRPRAVRRISRRGGSGRAPRRS
jgi:hypothetical protein